MNQNANKNSTALVLSGGGARGAYQAGMVKGIAEISHELGIERPFDVIVGVSAGSINASYLATEADDWLKGSQNLAMFWQQLKTKMIFRTDLPSLGKIGLQLSYDMLRGNLKHKNKIRALLDTEPLYKLLRQRLHLEKIGKNLESNTLRAVAISATDYGNSNNVTFVQSLDKSQSWSRTGRFSNYVNLEVGHVMASAAIPLFFPPVKVGNRYYGDGCLRNSAPLSPAIHLGGRKLIIIGVRKEKNFCDINEGRDVKPTVARVLSVLLNAILMDAIDIDLERLSRINKTVNALPEQSREGIALQPVEFLYLHPSEDIGDIAAEQASKMPRAIKFLIGGLGSLKEASDIISYLSFESEYMTRLVELGFRDAMSQRNEIQRILTLKLSS